METFTLGDTVRIKTGPFASFLGRVKAINRDRALLKIVVEIFGRRAPIILKFSEVEKLSTP